MDAQSAQDIGEEAISTEELVMKTKFEDELVRILKPKQNVIETRLITNSQIQKLIAIISEMDTTKRQQNYYYFEKKYYVIKPVTDGSLPLLAAHQKNKTDDVDRIIVGLESLRINLIRSVGRYIDKSVIMGHVRWNQKQKNFIIT